MKYYSSPSSSVFYVIEILPDCCRTPTDYIVKQSLVKQEEYQYSEIIFFTSYAYRESEVLIFN